MKNKIKIDMVQSYGITWYNKYLKLFEQNFEYFFTFQYLQVLFSQKYSF